MKNVSSTFRSELNNDNRIFINSCIITLSDGTVLSIDNSKIWDSGFKIEDAVSGSNSFDLGSVIIGKFTVSLNNIYDEYSIYDFTDCVASNVKIGLELPDGTVESVTYGKYYINEPKYNGAVITLEFCDCLYKFDKDYSLSKLEYPATLGQIVMDACDVCGVQLGTTSFSHDDYVVQSRPEDSALTFRQVLQWVGEISCNFCKADSQGRLSLSWYDTETLESLNRVDGGMFSPWIAGESIDGGAFDPWGTGDTFDGGSLLREDAGYHYIKSFSTLSLSTDDVVVTGVRVVQKSSDDNGSVSYQSGSDGYVISVEENKLIQGDMGNTVASMLGEKLIGLRFRPFTASCLSDPTIESGDIAVIMDVKGNFYNTVITSNMFQPGGYQNISCGAKTPARNSATRYSKITQVYVDYRKDIQKERTEREKALDKLSERINVSSGFFTTTETKEDGSKIYYMHNKPLLSESDIVWKMTAETWSVSTDGGETWNAGITVDGDTIVRILNAEGVNADWVRTGTLVVKDADGNILFSADMETGKVIVSGDSVRIGDKTVTKALEEIEQKADQATALSIVLDNDYQGIPADYEGNISTFPNVKTTVTVLYGHTDVSGDCTYTVTKSSGITGSWDSSTRTYSVTGLTTDTGWVDITAVYLGVFTVTKRFTVSKVKGGVPGQDGLNGQDGTDGVGVSSVDVQYYKSTSATSLTGGSWSTTNPGWENGKYIWSKTVITYTDESTDETTAVCVTGAKGSTGSTGADGSDGADGVGVESIVEQYYQSTSATSLTGGSWSTTYPGWVDGKYIWTRSVITYTDNTTTTTTAVCVTGSKGATGATGNGISSITEYYAVSSSNSTAPSSWHTTVPTMTTTNKYLWNYETIKYTDNTTKDTTKRVIGVYGNTGATGETGATGAAGKGISSITNYYLTTSASSGVTTSTSGWSITPTATTTTNKYLWNYEKITYTDNTTVSTSPCIIGVYGDKGDAGIPGRVYELSASTLAIKKGADNVLTPSSVTFSGFYRDGNSATRSSYSGRFKIEESTDGNTFTTKYTSSVNESDKSYTPSSSDVKVIRCTLYAAGGTTNALDLQSVVVLTDIDALTHEEIFNLLTNNGVVKGIYKEGDQLYISFTYAKGGELSLGGSNNKNGALRVYDENDEIFALIDMDNYLIKAVPQQLTTYDSFQMRRLIGMIKPAIEFKTTHSSSSESDYSVLINDIVTICNSNDVDKIIGDLLPNTSDPYIYMNENGLFWIDAGGSIFSAATLIKSSVNFPDAAASFKSLSVSGTKSRISNTENYNNRLLYCYEMPSPMFGDIGEAETDEAGECYIYLDDIFSETVSAQIEYQVFIQKEGQGDIWVDSKEPAFFVVKGTPNLKFAWEVKVKQKGYEYERLETFEREEQPQEIDYETEYMNEINQIITEQEDALYSTDK